MSEPQMPIMPSPIMHGGPPQSPNPSEEQTPLTLVRRLLRGRYLAACILAGILGVTGAAIGFTVAKPEYASTASLRVAPVLPKVLYESEANSMIPMFGAYLQTQISLIQSRRVVEMARETPEWKDVATKFPESDEEFPKGLEVVYPKGSQLLLVTYTDPEPRVAQTAAKAIVDAYLDIYGETDLVNETERLALLQERSRSLSLQIDRLRKEILNIANEFGSDDLEDVYAFKVQQLQSLESELKTAKLDLAIAESAVMGRSDVSDGDFSKLSVDDIAAIDPRMQSLTDELRKEKFELEKIEMIWKEPERRNDYQFGKKRVEMLETEIADYAKRFRETYSPDMTSGAKGMGESIAAMINPARARMKVERLQKLYDEAKTETLELGRKSLQIENLRAEMQRAQEGLDKTNFRIEQLSVESSVGGRISLLSQAELPSTPVNANRLKQIGILGGVGGAGLGMAIVLLVGLVNPRVRFIADAEDIRPRLVGALPDLPEKITDPTEAMIAAQCVHQIRTMLQSNSRSQDARVITVTSAASGTGKTSLALSLGLSFAAAGTRTLVIDGDPVGMGLTHRTGSLGRRKLGRVFQDYGIISEEEAEQAVALAHRSDSALGETLLGLGFIDDKELEEGLAIQRNCGMGLYEALEGANIDECTVDIGVPNLTILPASDAARRRTNILSREAMGDLIEELEDYYEMILIDAGPVPGPTDSAIMAACADGVLTIVARGEHYADVSQALQHLELLQAPLIGLVFNRARRRDLESSLYSTASSKQSAYSDAARAARREEKLNVDEAHTRYGPLVQAVWSMSNTIPDAVIVN